MFAILHLDEIMKRQLELSLKTVLIDKPNVSQEGTSENGVLPALPGYIYFKSI
jgi:hypothetical protein